MNAGSTACFCCGGSLELLEGQGACVGAFAVVGQSVARDEAVQKVTGQAVYTVDMKLPGMAYARIVRSPVPRARISYIRTDAARSYPGVLAVVTGEDLQRGLPVLGVPRRYGHLVKDRPLLATGWVRYEGEPVAAVVAVDEQAAEAAAALVELGLDVEEPVDSLEKALAPGAPRVHEDLVGASVDKRGWVEVSFERNICHHAVFQRGDVDRAWAECAVVVEGEFYFPAVFHYTMEPHACIADVREDRIEVFSSTQSPFRVREEVAYVFRVPEERVRVVAPYVGGGYGSKCYTEIEPLVVALSAACGRPVRLSQSPEESARTVRRHNAKIWMRSGLDSDGRLVCRQARIYLDTGAYADIGPQVALKAAFRLPGPYRIPHVRVEAYAVYTNTVPAGAFRGFGAVQAAWAYEAHTEQICKELGADPVEFRVRNLLRRGEEYCLGGGVLDGDPVEALLRAERSFPSVPGAHPEPAKATIRRRGIGVSCTMKDVTAAPYSARVQMGRDGIVTILANAPEIGSGARTVLRQIVAETLGLPMEQTTVAAADTDLTPYAFGVMGSRTTTVLGAAVQRAALDLKDKLLEVASAHLRCSKGAVRLTPQGVLADGRLLTYHELFEEAGLDLGVTGHGTAGAADAGEGRMNVVTWEISAAKAEVEVDLETGELRVIRYASVADVGRAIHPAQCEGQDEGAAMFGIGHTLFEQQVFEEGRLLNDGLSEYRVPTFEDLPDEFKTVLIENGDGPGPFGAKPVSEGGVAPVAPAVAAAIHQATGVLLRELPATPERLYRAMGRKPGGSP